MSIVNGITYCIVFLIVINMWNFGRMYLISRLRGKPFFLLVIISNSIVILFFVLLISGVFGIRNGSRW
jgi:hypothetical protein